MRALLVLIAILFTQTALAVENFPAPGRRDARVYIPTQYSKTKAWPVVVLLHGYLGSDGVIDSYFGYSKEVSKRGFILIVPNGKSDGSSFQFWNATDACCDFDHSGVDDVGYIKSLLAEVGAKYNIDRNHITVAGHSNGGFMAHRLACESDSPFSAALSLAGMTFQEIAKCKPTHPVSILQVHAVNDETVKYEGDPNGFRGLAGYPGALDTANSWVTLNHCGVISIAGQDKHITRDNITKPLSWLGCAGGVQVDLWTIQGPKTLVGSGHIPTLTQDFVKETLDFLLGPSVQ